MCSQPATLRKEEDGPGIDARAGIDNVVHMDSALWFKIKRTFDSDTSSERVSFIVTHRFHEQMSNPLQICTFQTIPSSYRFMSYIALILPWSAISQVIPNHLYPH